MVRNILTWTISREFRVKWLTLIISVLVDASTTTGLEEPSKLDHRQSCLPFLSGLASFGIPDVLSSVVYSV